MTRDRRPIIIEGPVQEGWVALGACVGSDPRVFFPGKGQDAAGPARRICAGCEVQAECLEYALTRPEKFGIWAGTTERQRRAMRKARRAA